MPEKAAPAGVAPGVERECIALERAFVKISWNGNGIFRRRWGMRFALFSVARSPAWRRPAVGHFWTRPYAASVCGEREEAAKRSRTAGNAPISVSQNPALLFTPAAGKAGCHAHGTRAAKAGMPKARETLCYLNSSRSCTVRSMRSSTSTPAGGVKRNSAGAMRVSGRKRVKRTSLALP